MAFHPSLRSLLLAHRFERDSQAARSARESVREARLVREANEKRLYEDRSGGYQGSESHVTGRNLDGPMG